MGGNRHLAVLFFGNEKLVSGWSPVVCVWVWVCTFVTFVVCVHVCLCVCLCERERVCVAGGDGVCACMRAFAVSAVTRLALAGMSKQSELVGEGLRGEAMSNQLTPRLWEQVGLRG